MCGQPAQYPVVPPQAGTGIHFSVACAAHVPAAAGRTGAHVGLPTFRAGPAQCLLGFLPGPGPGPCHRACYRAEILNHSKSQSRVSQVFFFLSLGQQPRPSRREIGDRKKNTNRRGRDSKAKGNETRRFPPHKRNREISALCHLWAGRGGASPRSGVRS